jgi:two-component system chemotaxis sensor kinase CheA
MHKKIPELRSIAEHVDRLTAELRDSTMSIRMLPIGTTFSKFNRLVRDLSSELGKEVILTIDGAETELDKTVIERIHDPLVHLIRNSIDHGIESPGVRASNGKPRQGTVHLSAIHSGANVLISIEDDGAGLNKEAIRKKAVENGLISPDVELSEKEVFGLIFAPGFSTAGKVTNVSGRGVGMDVVKSGVEALRGAIDIASREGAGTTITLKLPLTLAIVDGLLVKIADANFVLPLSIVEECVELTNGGGAAGHGRQVTFIRGEIVPYIRLRERFSIDGPAPPIEQIVVTETMGGRIGFVVDKVIGQHQTVIKNMGKIYRNVKGVSGATILGDGTVALIVDVPQIVQGAAALEDGPVH